MYFLLVEKILCNNLSLFMHIHVHEAQYLQPMFNTFKYNQLKLSVMMFVKISFVFSLCEQHIVQVKKRAYNNFFLKANMLSKTITSYISTFHQFLTADNVCLHFTAAL